MTLETCNLCSGTGITVCEECGSDIPCDGCDGTGEIEIDEE